MGPLALKLWQSRTLADADKQSIIHAQHFFISEAITDACDEIVRKARPDDSVEFSFKLPARSIWIECAALPGYAVRVTRLTESKVSIHYYAREGELAVHVAERRGPLKERILRLNEHSNKGASLATDIVNTYGLDILLALLCEPRLVKRSAANKSTRRRAARVFRNTPLPEWHRVTWTIGDKVVGRDRNQGTGDRRPLHFCRAHWRRADSGMPSAERRPGHDGWWVWVSHSFKGHPDFGVRLHHYMPNIDPDGKSLAAIAAAEAMVGQWRAA
jgi:hypothetical protein